MKYFFTCSLWILSAQWLRWRINGRITECNLIGDQLDLRRRGRWPQLAQNVTLSNSGTGTLSIVLCQGK